MEEDSELSIYATGLPSCALSLNSGVVVFPSQNVIIKRPYKSRWDYEYDNGREAIENEKVYRRLQQCDGVIPFLDLSGPAIQLPFMEKRDIVTYLQNHHASRYLQLSWLRQIAHTLARIHEHRVLFCDGALRNYLLTPDLSILLCDFGVSALLPLDTDIWTAEVCGFTFETDIGDLGAAIYELVTGTRVDFDIFEDPGQPAWPSRESLPDTQGLWLGEVIDACWTQGRFKTSHELYEMLDAVPDPANDDGESRTSESSFSKVSKVISQAHNPATDMNSGNSYQTVYLPI